MIVQVKCTFIIPVEVSNDKDFDLHFAIEDNGCPGTGAVGKALDEHIKQHEAASTCWACALQAECQIVSPGRGDNDAA